jgi:hypothetical protein
MTWAKTGCEFPDDCANVDLSDAGYRTHHEGISWLFLVERTDCRIPKRLLHRIVASLDAAQAVAELLAHGFWRDTGDAYEVRHQGDTIRGGIVAQQKKRASDKKGQQKQRDKAKASDHDVIDDVIDDPNKQTTKQAPMGEGSQSRNGDNPRFFRTADEMAKEQARRDAYDFEAVDRDDDTEEESR